MAKKKAKKAGKKRKPNAAFMKPMNPSAALGAVIGNSAMPRTEVTKKIWAYIKRNSLQDKKTVATSTRTTSSSPCSAASPRSRCSR